VLRAAAGECVRVTLINDLPDVLQKTPHWNFLPPITEEFNQNQVPISPHVSMHPHLVQFDVTRDDGTNVGLNPVQTVAPGDQRTYEWYAGQFTARRVKYDERTCNEANVIMDDGDRSMLVFDATPIEFGSINLRSFADVVNHGTHGLVGMLIVEPEGAEWSEDPRLQAQATVQYVDPEQGWVSFREQLPVHMNEIALHSNRPEFQCTLPLDCGTALLPYDAADDAEESGHTGFNHRTEPFWAREGIPPEIARVELNERDLSDILDSDEHGDPETPIFTARAGDEVRVRIGFPSGHPRMLSYTLHGHGWDWNPYEIGTESTRQGPDPDSFQVGSVGGLAPGAMWNANPLFGAGGAFRVPGDYLYRGQNSFIFPDGMWGLFRVQR
jgi:manganese oxidase